MKRMFESDRIILVFLVLAGSLLMINSRALWFSDEIRYADAYSNLVNYKKWIVLFLNGEPYPDKPPVYFWFIWLVQNIFRLSIPSAMFLASSFSGIIYIMAHYSFALHITEDRKTAFVSSLILLTNIYFLALLNYIRMDMLFSAFIIIGFMYIYLYLTEEKVRYLYYAMLASSVAVVIKGPLGVLFPLVLLLAAGMLMRKYRRIFNLHTFIAIFICSIPSLLWLYSITLIEGRAFLEDILYNQVLRRATNTWHHAEPFYYYVYSLPLAWLPWILVFAATLLSIPGRVAGVLSRAGGMFAFVTTVSGFILLSALSGKIAIYALPLFSPIAIFFAYYYADMEKGRFWQTMSVFFVVLGFFLVFMNKLHLTMLPLDTAMTSAAAFITAFVIYGYRNHKYSLYVFTAVMLVFFNITCLTLLKSADDLMSPKKQAEKMKSYMDKGYKPIAFKVYSGLYSYYVKSPVKETKDLEYVGSELQSDKKVVLGIAEKHWKEWNERPEKDVLIVDRQWVAGRTYLLMVNK